MGRVQPINWSRIDATLLKAAMLPRRRLAPALRQIAQNEKISLDAIKSRLKFLEVTALDPQLGPDAAARWLKHMKELIKISSNNMALLAMATDRYYQVMDELRAQNLKEYSSHQAARLLQVSHQTMLFWADTLKAIARNPRGNFTGRELRRFWETEKHLLAAARAVQRVEARKGQK